MMPTWSELHLLQWRFPWGALVVLLPLALAWLAHRQQQRLAGYADAHLLPWAVVQTGPGLAVGRRKVLEVAAWLLLALAATGPRLPAATNDAAAHRSAPPHVVDLMVVLDVSASMAATDVAPDRLSRARLELTDLLKQLNGERLGLMLYAAQAGLLLPPTDDAALFERALSQAGADLLDAQGTDLAQALRLARQTLLAEAASVTGLPPRSRAVLLVTDADTSSLDGAAGKAAQQAAQTLRADDIPLFVLTVASTDGAPVPLAGGGQATQNGPPMISGPDVRAYRRLAQDSGGELALVSNGDADWNALYDSGIARLRGAAVNTATAQAWHELFAWPLGLALVLLLGVYLPPPEKRALAQAGVWLAVLVGSAGMPPPAQAQDAPNKSTPSATTNATSTAQAAAQAYRNAQWRQAQTLFTRQGGYAGHMGGGAAAWKLRDYTAASRHFSTALLLARTDSERGDALYNLGNAYFGQAQWDRAAQAWRAVLLSRPADAAAATNLVQAEAQLAKRAGNVPMKSDLRGRRGFLAEGQVSIDGAVDAQDESLDLPELPQGPRSAGAADAAGARLSPQADAAGMPSVQLDPQRLQSGLVKLERLEERQRDLLRGLLKQDRVPAPPSASAGVPW